MGAGKRKHGSRSCERVFFGDPPHGAAPPRKVDLLPLSEDLASPQLCESACCLPKDGMQSHLSAVLGALMSSPAPASVPRVASAALSLIDAGV